MKKPPKYRHHKPRNLAVVRIDGRDHYLGDYDSPESWELYYQLLAERAGSGKVHPKAKGGLNVSDTFLWLDDARLVIDVWRDDYNRHRPHGALGNPLPFND